MSQATQTKRTNCQTCQPFTATALQIRRAYEKHFKTEFPGTLPFAHAGLQLIDALGREKGQAFILAQSNDPKAA